jgi:dihydroorotate dehydrogenase
MTKFFNFMRPLVHCLPPEMAHALGIFALRAGILPSAPSLRYSELTLNVLGHSFPNPIGLAAGFDKNAAATARVLAQGFGFVEAGTVTPKPQAGNPKPRIFRLAEDEAVINRLGFNNHGLEAFAARLRRRDRGCGIVGANIGKNKDSADAVADYAHCLRIVYPHADYITINISSPNTPGLRALQKRAALIELLTQLTAVRDECAIAHGRHVKLLLKVAPDLDHQEKEDIADKAPDCGIDGIIVGNTTLSRPTNLKSWDAAEQGGLSGKPLFDLSTQVLKDFYRLTGGRILLVGTGGIASAADAYRKIRAGATLVQLYTALVYQGFGLVREIEEGMLALLKQDGFTHISEAIGADVR